MTDAHIAKTIYLDAPPETVWRFLTEAEKLGRWFHPAEADLAASEPFRLMAGGTAVCWGEVRVADRPSRLVYSFTVGRLDGRMTEVEWRLEPVAGGTRVSLTHTGLPQDAASFGLLLAMDKGWDEHFANLRPAIA